MAGSVFFGVIFVLVLLLILTGIASPLWLVPIVVIGLALLLLTPMLAKLRGSGVVQPGSGPQGVPTTREASYEPVHDPTEQRP
jgi:hypothetical protein